MTSDIQAWRERRAPTIPPIEHKGIQASHVAEIMARESDRILSHFIRSGDMDGVMLDDGFYVKDEDLKQSFWCRFQPTDIAYAPDQRRAFMDVIQVLRDELRRFLAAFRASGQIVAMRHCGTYVTREQNLYGQYVLEMRFKYAAFKRL